MAENTNNMELPGASEDTAKQDEAEAVKTEEKMERLMLDELEKFALEGEAKENGEGLTLQDAEKGKIQEEKDRPAIQDEEAPERREETKREGPPKEEWDTLTLQDDGLPLREEKEEKEKEGRGLLAWQAKEETPADEEKTEAEEEPRLSMDDILNIMKEEEEEEEDQEEEEAAPQQDLRVPQTTGVTMWSQYRERIKFAVQKRKLSFPHLGYFTKVFSQDSSASEMRKKSKEEPVVEQPRKWDREPMLSRLFTMIPSDSHPKKFALRWPTGITQRECNLSRLSKVTGSSLEEDHDMKASESQAAEIEMDDLCSRSPEILLSKFEEPEAETFAETKMEEAEAASSHPKKLQAGSFYSYQDGGTIEPGVTSSVWSMGQRISHWRMAHNRVSQAEQNLQEKVYKQRLLKHERETKTTVPLPLQEKIEEEVLAILMDTYKDYQKKLGMHHPLTTQMEEQVDKIYLQLHARGVV
nr:rRNA-processing protein EBP2-like [Pogona vitticeps]